MNANFLTINGWLLVLDFTGDLDRPRSGYIRVSQQPLIDVQQQMQANAHQGP
jgi:hypothetical protein